MVEFNSGMIERLLDIIDAGLCSGKGQPVPGGMCVQAAVTVILGEKFSDQPTCVHPVLRSFGIKLNDSRWSSDVVRAKGLRRFSVAQLGTSGWTDKQKQFFSGKMVNYTFNTLLPEVLTSSTELFPQYKDELSLRINRLKVAQALDELRKATIDIRDLFYKIKAASADAAADAYAANAAANAANAAANAANADANAAAYAAAAYVAINDPGKADQILAATAEYAVQVLVEMNTPGSKFLFLTEEVQHTKQEIETCIKI